MTTLEEKKKIEEYVRMADTALKQRKPAPKHLTVSDVVTIPQKDLINRLAPHCVGKDATHHPCFVGENQLREYAMKGFKPSLFEGELIRYQADSNHTGDVLVELPIKLHEENKEFEVRKSAIMLGEVEQESSGVGETVEGSQVITEQTKLCKPGTPEYEEAKREAGVD